MNDIEQTRVLISLLKTKEQLEASIQIMGEVIHGDCFECADINDGFLTVYTESGHDWECDEWRFDMEGNELSDEEGLI